METSEVAELARRASEKSEVPIGGVANWTYRVGNEWSEGIGPPLTYFGEMDDYYRDEVLGTTHAGYVAPNAALPTGLATTVLAGGGRGTTQVSQLKALMESIERSCLSSMDTSQHVTRPEEELRLNGEYPILGSREYAEPWRGTWDSHADISWCIADSLSGKHLVPASLVYCPYPGTVPTHLLDPSSSGAAAGFSVEGAVLRGALELIERHHAVSSHLYSHRAVRQLDPFSVARDPFILRALLEADSLGIDVRLYQLTDGDVATVVCHAIDRSNQFPRQTFGSGASMDAADAASSAALEALFVRRQIRDYLVGLQAPPANQVESIGDRLLFWASREVDSAFDYLEGGRIAPPSIEEAVANARFFWVEITTPAAARLGVHVVKVISPDLQPIYFDESRKSVLTLAGSASINKEPHPYG